MLEEILKPNAIACPIKEKYELEIICPSENNCQEVIEFTELIAQTFPRIKRITFFVKESYITSVPAIDFR